MADAPASERARAADRLDDEAEAAQWAGGGSAHARAQVRARIACATTHGKHMRAVPRPCSVRTLRGAPATPGRAPRAAPLCALSRVVARACAALTRAPSRCRVCRSARGGQAGYGGASGGSERPPPAPPRDDAAAELAQELKAQANRLLQSGQVEAAEIVYSEALKARTRARTQLPTNNTHGTGALLPSALRASSRARCSAARAGAPHARAHARSCGARGARGLIRAALARARARARARRPFVLRRSDRFPFCSAAAAHHHTQHDPSAHQVLANRALARVKLGRMADAVADARAAAALAPTWAKGHARLGASACFSAMRCASFRSPIHLLL
jgi:hypothetical protein